jgi:hypothetical protein
LLGRVGLQILHVDVDIEYQVGDLLDLASDGDIRLEFASIIFGASTALAQVGSILDLSPDGIRGHDLIATALL